MATFGEISSNLVVGAGQSVRRNAQDSEFEAYTPSAGGAGLGYALTVTAANLATTTDAQTIYFGSLAGVAPSSTAAISRIYIPKTGTIKVAQIVAHAATAGTGESWSLYVRLNNTTDTLIQTVASTAAFRTWINTSLSIAVVAGDYIEIKSINPTWATNPANVRFGGVIYIE